MCKFLGWFLNAFLEFVFRTHLVGLSRRWFVICKSTGFYSITHSRGWRAHGSLGLATPPKWACFVFSLSHRAEQPFSTWAATSSECFSFTTHLGHFCHRPFFILEERRPRKCCPVIFTYWSYIFSPPWVPHSKLNLIQWPKMNVYTSKVEEIIA